MKQRPTRSHIVLMGTLMIPFFSLAARISLKEAYQSALLHHESVAIESLKTEQGSAQIDQIKSGLFPHLSASATYLRQDTPTNSSTTNKEQKTVKLTATQALFHGLKEFSALKIARYSKDKLLESEEQNKLRLYALVAESFYNVLSTEQDIKNYKLQLELTQQRIKELNLRTQTGRSRKSELMSARVQESLIKSQIEVAQTGIDQARSNFENISRLSKDSALIDESTFDTLKLLPLDHYLSRVHQRPDIKALSLQVSAAEETKVYTRGSYFPSLDFIGNYYLNRSGGSSTNSKWDVGLSLTMPLFEGGITRAEQREVAAKLQEAKLLLELQKKNAEEEIRQAYKNTARNSLQIKSLKEAVALAQTTYQELSKDYRHGLATNLDVLQAMNTQLDAKQSLDHTRFQLRLAWAELQAGTATILDTTLTNEETTR